MIRVQGSECCPFQVCSYCGSGYGKIGGGRVAVCRKSSRRVKVKDDKVGRSERVENVTAPSL